MPHPLGHPPPLGVVRLGIRDADPDLHHGHRDGLLDPELLRLIHDFLQQKLRLLLGRDMQRGKLRLHLRRAQQHQRELQARQNDGLRRLAEPKCPRLHERAAHQLLHDHLYAKPRDRLRDWNLLRVRDLQQWCMYCARNPVQVQQRLSGRRHWPVLFILPELPIAIQSRRRLGLCCRWSLLADGRGAACQPACDASASGLGRLFKHPPMPEANCVPKMRAPEQHWGATSHTSMCRRCSPSAAVPRMPDQAEAVSRRRGSQPRRSTRLAAWQPMSPGGPPAGSTAPRRRIAGRTASLTAQGWYAHPPPVQTCGSQGRECTTRSRPRRKSASHREAHWPVGTRSWFDSTPTHPRRCGNSRQTYRMPSTSKGRRGEQYMHHHTPSKPQLEPQLERANGCVHLPQPALPPTGPGAPWTRNRPGTPREGEGGQAERQHKVNTSGCRNHAGTRRKGRKSNSPTALRSTKMTEVAAGSDGMCKTRAKRGANRDARGGTP